MRKFELRLNGFFPFCFFCFNQRQTNRNPFKWKVIWLSWLPNLKSIFSLIFRCSFKKSSDHKGTITEDQGPNCTLTAIDAQNQPSLWISLNKNIKKPTNCVLDYLSARITRKLIHLFGGWVFVSWSLLPHQIIQLSIIFIDFHVVISVFLTIFIQIKWTIIWEIKCKIK